MNPSVRLAAIFTLVLGVGAVASNAAPAGAQVTDTVSTTTVSLAETMKGRPLADQVEAYGRTDTDNMEQDCLASAVYFEARGEVLEGQLAVAEVVMNRAASGKYPATICGVVEQPWQFSFVNATKRIPNANRSSEAWRKAVAIARIAQDRVSDQLTDDVLWYHAEYVSPSWGRRLNRSTKIGLHIFYR
jgi:spore germination cell wall hydrolase CwlJ-like protein